MALLGLSADVFKSFRRTTLAKIGAPWAHVESQLRYRCAGGGLSEYTVVSTHALTRGWRKAVIAPLVD